MSSKLQGEYLKSLADECVQEYVLNEQPEHTIKNIRNFLGRFLKWVGNREITPKLCRDYVKYMQVDRGLAWSSVSSDTRRLKMFLFFLRFKANEGEGVIDRDWAKEVHSPRVYGKKNEEPEQLISPEKMEELVYKVTEPGTNDHKLHRKIKAEHRAFLLFLMKTGFRPGEAMNIKPEHVNLDSKYPHVLVWRGKGKNGGEWKPLGLPLDYLEPIKERVEKGRWFNVNQRRLQIYMQRLSKLAGKKQKLYSIRKSVDTFAIDAGAPLMELSVHQGHTVGTMQDAYVKFSAKQSSEVNNTYNPWIDRNKLPVEYSVPKVKQLIKELQNHPNFKINRGEKSVTFEWK